MSGGASGVFFSNDNSRRRSSQLEIEPGIGHSTFFTAHDYTGSRRRSSTLTASRESFRKSTASIKRKLFCRNDNSNGSATIVNKPLECNPELAKRLSEYSSYLLARAWGFPGSPVTKTFKSRSKLRRLYRKVSRSQKYKRVRTTKRTDVAPKLQSRETSMEMHLRTFCLPFYELSSLPIFSTFSMPESSRAN